MDGSVTLLFQVDMEKRCLEFVFFLGLYRPSTGTGWWSLTAQAKKFEKKALVRGIGPKRKTKKSKTDVSYI